MVAAEGLMIGGGGGLVTEVKIDWLKGLDVLEIQKHRLPWHLIGGTLVTFGKFRLVDVGSSGQSFNIVF